ncbi:hypothetical protein GGI19_003547 [Coemansia pectinata]|uniref:Uncharacterized protein n=1 Tax=Coemansia pectinata TaxID=1052879 RepID=A0A9W8H0H0_9FUNG|nr:hypothetical protein GGI19_003547 [Coemansia pectinata]
MSATSPLLTLPLHIVHMIVDYVASCSRLRLDGVAEDTDAYGMLLWPLVRLFDNFFAVTSSYYCKTYTMDLIGVPGFGGVRQTSWASFFQHINFPKHKSAQVLEFWMTVQGVGFGYSLKKLLDKPFVAMVFPKVLTIEFSFPPVNFTVRPEDAIRTTRNIESNISAFVARIKQIAPRVKNTLFTMQGPNHSNRRFPADLKRSLFTQLGQLGYAVQHNYQCRPMRVSPPLTGLTSMVYVNIDESDRSELPMRLARHNAATLEVLKIYFHDMEGDISTLIQKPDGSYVQYQRLHTFALFSQPDMRISRRPVFPGALPFPILRHMEIGAQYFFSDDTPFRGNATSLQFLELSLSTATVTILKEHNVFTPDSHSKLQYVNIGQPTDISQDIFGTDIEYVQFVLSVAPNGVMRIVATSLASPDFQSIVSVLGDHSCIRVLSLLYKSLSLWDAMALVKALPNLSDLTTASVSINPQPRSVSNDGGLPAYVIENYAPMSKHFRCWSIEVGGDSNPSDVVKCVLLMALACPNFDYAAVTPKHRELFMAHMQDKIKASGFRQHEERLRRLLFGGWENKFSSVKVAQARRLAEAAVESYEDYMV